MEHLAAENRLMDELQELIRQEQDLLIASNVKGIASVIDQKSKLISELACLTHRRHQTLAAAGFQADESGMEDWLSQNTDSGVSTIRQKLMDKVMTARECNRTNGLLINTKLNRNRNSLNILRGADNTGNFYGPNGQTTQVQLSRNFVVG